MGCVAAPTRTRDRAKGPRASARAASPRAWDTPERLPIVHAQSVDRGRLTALLETAVARPVTLVAAPAGAGKTMLMADWARLHRTSGRVTWLTLSSAEATASGFWNALVPALGKAAARGPAPDTPEAVAER